MARSQLHRFKRAIRSELFWGVLITAIVAGGMILIALVNGVGHCS